jgi:polar amino acid transport system substrate-binding protein
MAPDLPPTNTSAPIILPTNPPPPTAPPATSGDPVWDRVQAARKLVIGTSADYQPFEYYDATGEIIGFDAALARNIGAKLGLDVQIVDIAFEGLPAALVIGQIDAAMAAISVTSERQMLLDFTNVYYSGQDAVLARAGSGVPQIVTPAQLAQYRVAAQRGSVYGSWVQKTLIDTGLMPQTNLLLYDKAGEAVRDLRENRNDLVILDKLAADEYVLNGGVVAVGQNLNRQLFSIALAKGSTILQSQLNNALTALQNDGTIARLAETYLDTKVSPGLPVQLPTMIPVPGPTQTPVPCYDAMEFRRDMTVPDGTQISAGQNFDKTWRLRNTGTCVWNNGYQLVFVQGDWMGGTPGVVTSRINAGNAFDVTVRLQAPVAPGNYSSVWQMVNDKGTPFGQRIWVRITVPGVVPPTATPPPPTAVPPVQPTLAPGPVIDYLNVSADTVQQGGLLIVSWSFSGESLASARLTRTNPDGSQTPLFGGIDVVPQGQYEDLMMAPGTYSYTLTVSSESGGTSARTVVVNVNSN